LSDDIPLERTAGTVTSQQAADPTGTPGLPRFWERYIAVCFVALAAFTYLGPTAEPVAERLSVLGLLAMMAGWYLTLGRRVVTESETTWRGPVFQAVLFAMYVAALYLIGAFFLLFIVCPLAYMTLPTRAAHAVVTLYAFTPAAVALAWGGPATLALTLPIGVIAITMSMVIAVTTDRIERRSEERAALIEELESTRAEVARLSRDAGIAEERQRLAGDIHDTVAQGLSSVVMLVEAADAALVRDPDAARAHLSLAARTARDNLDETRAIVAALTPSSLTKATLADALGRLADRFTRDVGTTTTLSTVGDPAPLPTQTEVVLLRVVQEALNNVRKHAGASSVSVTLTYRPDAVSVEVRDDGVGFDVAALRPGYGLGGMQARVEQVGGRLSIASTQGSGTTIRTEVNA
jgi:signal transduction histidine kinase